MNFEKIFIPIGTDCGTTNAIKEHNLRFFSLPFDWVVTYNGVTDIIVNKFNNYLFPNKQFNVSCHTFFAHNVFPKDFEKMKRRIDRFMDLLKSEKQLIFIRKSHFTHHHEESKKFNCILKNDLQDCCELHDHLKNSYPKLKFKIICILCCEKCFQYNNTPYTKSIKIDNIHVYNISKKTTTKEKDNIFDELIKSILSVY